MKAILIPAEGEARIIELDNELKALQKAVGGYIETVTMSGDCCLVCDEEGLLKGKPLNKAASRLGTPFVGDVLVCGVDYDRFTDVPEPMIEMMKERFSIL